MLTDDATPAPEQPPRPAGNQPAQPPRLRGRALAGLLALGLLATAVFSIRLLSLPPLHFAADDPALQAAGFYAPETGADGSRFRWSRPSAGLLLPALAARQVYTLEIATPRPAGVPFPAGLTLVANGTRRPLVLTPGWAPYSLTAGSQVGLDNAVALVAGTVDDSFYPAAGDRRHLTAAVRGVTLALAREPGGWIAPAPLLLLATLLIPALAFAAVGRGWRGPVAGLATLGLGGLIWLLPPTALPAGLVGVALILGAAALGRALVQSGAALAAGLSRALGQPQWGRLLEWGGLTAILTALAVVATWPLATHLADSVLGWPGDNFAFLYKIWWVRMALSTGANLFNDPHVFYPFGFNFGRGEPTLPNTVPGALLATIGGEALGYNVVLLAGFVLSGLGTYGLARAVGTSRSGALLAGILFMLAPYRLGQASGHLQIAATQWIPLSLLAAERAVQGRRGAAAVAGLCYGLTVLTAWYYAIIGGLLLGGYGLIRLWQTRRGPPPRPGRALLGLLLPFLIVAGLVALPGLVVALQAAGETPLTHSAKAADENSASVADYLIPNELQPLWGALAMEARGGENIIESTLYLGLPALLLAGVALWPRRLGRDGRALPWAVLGGICLVLSLGLSLRVLPGELVTIGGAPLPLPARLLFDWIPGFNSLRAYARFGGGVALAVAVLAALGATRLLAPARVAGRRLALATLLLGAVLADFWSAPNAWGLTTVAPDAVAGWLAQQPAGAVIRLPLTAAIAGPPLYAGIAYQHPLAYGYETFEPPGFTAARPVLARFPKAPSFDLLRRWGVRYVVVAASSYGADWAATRAAFAQIPDWTPVYQAPQPVIYHAPFWIGDIETTLRDALAPDELVVYRLR